MGQAFEFKCLQCDYKVTVSGGLDCGMVAVVRTMRCDACREIVDVLVGSRGRVGAMTGDAETDANMNRCPCCRGQALQPWQETDGCPKCGGQVERSEDAVFLWD